MAVNPTTPAIPTFRRRVGGLVRRVKRSLFPAGRAMGLILAYHRVTNLEVDPQLLCVSPERFREQLDVLCRFAAPARLREICPGGRGSSSKAIGVAVTFDDGYADNLLSAKPLLARYGVPATVFVTTGRLDQPGEFWWDELESLLLGSGDLPASLTCEIGGQTRRWDLTGVEDNSTAWNVLDTQFPTARHRAYLELCGLLRPLEPERREEVLAEIRRQTGRRPARRDSHCSLTADEVLELSAGGLVEVGAHTVNHPVLSSLSPVAQQAEIEGSLVRLRNILGKSPESFSFPFGTRADYDRASVAIVQDLGFQTACANEQGPVRRTDSLHELPRLLVRNWTGDEFEARLREWSRE